MNASSWLMTIRGTAMLQSTVDDEPELDLAPETMRERVWRVYDRRVREQSSALPSDQASGAVDIGPVGMPGRIAQSDVADATRWVNEVAAELRAGRTLQEAMTLASREIDEDEDEDDPVPLDDEPVAEKPLPLPVPESVAVTSGRKGGLAKAAKSKPAPKPAAPKCGHAGGLPGFGRRFCGKPALPRDGVTEPLCAYHWSLRLSVASGAVLASSEPIRAEDFAQPAPPPTVEQAPPHHAAEQAAVFVAFAPAKYGVHGPAVDALLADRDGHASVIAHNWTRIKKIDEALKILVSDDDSG